MEIKRFFADAVVNNTVVLRGDEFYHCTKVTRHKVGFTIIVCVGDGFDYYCRIDSVAKDSLTASVIKREPNSSEIEGEIVLYQAVCKELDFIIQKAVELGVTKIVPFYSANTNIANVKSDRLNKIVAEAAKQCGRATLPIVEEAIRFDKVIELSKNTASRVFCYEKSKNKCFEKSIDKKAKSVSIIIGSEGGFTEQEVAYASEKGVPIVTLGKRVLRAETASITAIVLALNCIGEM